MQMGHGIRHRADVRVYARDLSALQTKALLMRTYFKKTRKKYVDPLRGVGGNKHMKALRKRFKEVAAARGGVTPKNAWLMGL